MGTTTSTAAAGCGECVEEAPGHAHYALIVTDPGEKLRQRRCPDGTRCKRVIYAVVLDPAVAKRIAESGGAPETP